MAKSYHNLAGGTFAQDWSNTGQITANDNWNGVLSIEGYLGQDITLLTGADPQTLTTDSAVANDLDVIANQTNPNVLAAGGVAEFDSIANPTVALNGSGTADAPHLIIYLDTTNVQNVRVQYDARDLDGSTDDAVSPLALQYRVGETGSWTNVPAAFIADATTGPSLATLVTHVDVVLPAAVENHPQVQLRIITTNSAGNDEWIGIDNIVVSSTNSSATAPVFNNLDDTPIFTENSFAVLLDGDATVSDPDLNANSPIDGATLTLARVGGASLDDFISGNFDEGQVISQNSGLVVGFAVIADGALTVTFNSDAIFADVNDVLQQLTYANVSDAPPPSVVIGYTFNNGEVATGSITVTINQANDAPSIDALAGSAVFQLGSSGVVLSPNVSLSDFDSPMLSSATVAFSGGSLSSDVLSADVGSTGIVADYTGGVLTLSASAGATIEQFRQVLQTVTYSSTVADPSNGGSAPERTLNWSITDNATPPANSFTVSTVLDFGPSVDLDASGAGIGFATTFTQGGAPVAIADTDADIIAPFQSIGGVSVILTNAKAGDVLAAIGGPLTVTVDNSQPGRIALLISGSGSETAYENTLRSVTFSNASANIDPAARDLSVVVTDFAGNPSVAAHSAITIAGAVNDPGSAADDTASTAFNTALTVAAPGVLANDNDPDGLVVTTGSVATTGGGAIQFQADGSYSYTPAANFSGTDSVVYTAQDPFGSQVSATLRITVDAPPVPPTPPGTPGDDSFTASGNQQFDGGLGTDTITFNFRLVDATVTYSGNQIIVDSGSTHTVLTGFEVFNFTDGTVNNKDADPLVDDLFYYAKYHDVWNAHADADAHFHSTGWKEGRDPDAFFSTAVYLSANPDVKAAGVDPLTHFDTIGWKQGRGFSITFDSTAYLAANPDVQASNIDPLRHYLANGYQEGRQPIAPTELLTANGFDYVYYLTHNPDVAAAGVDPFQHFQTVGWKEGRNPNALFDTSGYLNNYLDVKAANVNPLDHYNQFGWHEGRDPSVGFDTTSYLAAYNDVKAANINPLNHFLDFGVHEGRSPFADGIWG